MSLCYIRFGIRGSCVTCFIVFRRRYAGGIHANCVHCDALCVFESCLWLCFSCSDTLICELHAYPRCVCRIWLQTYYCGCDWKCDKKNYINQWIFMRSLGACFVNTCANLLKQMVWGLSWRYNRFPDLSRSKYILLVPKFGIPPALLKKTCAGCMHDVEV